MNAIVRDNGWKSRKLGFGTFAVIAMFMFALLATKLTGLAVMYDTFVSGVLGVTGLLFTGSVVTKWIGTKVPAGQAQPVEAESEDK